MFKSRAVTQLPATAPHVFAFRISGHVTSDDMEAMSEFMNARFEEHDSVNMLLIFEAFEGRDTGAGLNWETIKAQTKSLSKVDRYAVVGAPGSAETMIGAMDKIIPVDARTFEPGEEAAAWTFVGASPSPRP